MSDHERIWLEPEDCADPYGGRQWCEDNIGSEDENGHAVSWIEYVRADIADAEIARLAARVAELNAWSIAVGRAVERLTGQDFGLPPALEPKP